MLDKCRDLSERIDHEFECILKQMKQLENYRFRQHGDTDDDSTIELVERTTGKVIRTMPVDGWMEWWAQQQLFLSAIFDGDDRAT